LTLNKKFSFKIPLDKKYTFKFKFKRSSGSTLVKIRFCGPATAVEIPTVTAPHKMIKTRGQCVAETGLQFAVLALYPSQLATLQSREKTVFISGPPGTGKSIVLALKVGR
jgi:hypothetical protein